MNKDLYCVIMAGGVGSRFWPVSRNEKPKQFLDFLGVGRTFIQQTYDRCASFIPNENFIIVTSALHKDIVLEQLPNVPEKNVLLEPFRRNTAPCIAYASYRIKKENPNATIVVAPSDHYISNELQFIDTIKKGMELAAKEEKLFTIGIPPSRPETAYGYIQANLKEQEIADGAMIFTVKTFTEKPNKELAEVFIKSGEFLWNSGIFIWSVSSIVGELEKWLPEVALLFKEGEEMLGTDQEDELITNVYQDCPTISIDYGVMEKTDIASVIQATFGWSDLGTWNSLYLHAQLDENNNFVSCDEKMMDKVKDCVVISTEKDKLMAIKEMNNMMIINTKDVLMICPRDEVRFKNMITDLTIYEKTKFQ